MREFMRIVEGYALPVGTLLHASPAELPIGTVLTPRGETYDGADSDVEDILESTRPAHRQPRNAVIYMARDKRTLENVARSDGFIYLVRPSERPVRFDAAWINRIWATIVEHDDDVEECREIVTGYAQAFWTGAPCPAYQPGHEAIWEYVAQSATIMRDVSGLI